MVVLLGARGGFLAGGSGGSPSVVATGSLGNLLTNQSHMQCLGSLTAVVS